MIPDKDFDLCVGLRIREVRENLHMSRAVFSERCDISESFLAAIESGKKAITSKTMYKICTAFNISADYLIIGKNNSFEIDGLIALFESLDSSSRETAYNILREYTKRILELKEDNSQ